MLAALLAAAVAVATPTPSPVPEPLKTIASVKSSPFCGQFATHVNAAISSAVANDANLGTVVATLKRSDLEGTSLDREAEIVRLTTLADAIYHQYRTGDAEIARLRALAALTTDPQQKADLQAANDALAGALYRQHLIQRDLDGFVAYLQAADMTSLSDGQRAMNEANLGEADPHQAALDMELHTRVGVGAAPFASPYGGLAGSETPSDDTRYAKTAADDFVKRFAPLVGDEISAAAHIETVSSRC